MRGARALIAFLCAMIIAPASSRAAAGECFDFNPGISYLPLIIDSGAIRAPFKNAVAYALASTFSEQIAIGDLAKDDSRFDEYKISDTKTALSTALGVGGDASYLFSPLEPDAKNDDVAISLIPSDESSILSDLSTIYITRGFITRISDQAIRTVFGSPFGYQQHLRDLVDHDYSPFLSANGIDVVNNGEIKLPLGYMLFGKKNVANDQVVDSVRAFTKEFLGKLLFATAHEIGHIRLHHNETKYGSCEEFQRRELAADAYAAIYLARFSFRMEPDNARKQNLIDFRAFFESYGEYDFSNTSADGNCAYPSPKERETQVRRVVYNTVVQLTNQTYSSADYTTPNPTSSICSSDSKTWRLGFDDKATPSLDEARQKSIIESRKVQPESAN